jgi:hypothetical protein
LESFVEHGTVPSHSLKECSYPGDPGFYLEFGDGSERVGFVVLSKFLITVSCSVMVFKHLEGMDTLNNFGVKVNLEGP